MGVVKVAFAAPSRDSAMFAAASIGRRFLDFQGCFRVLVRGARTALAYALRRLRRCRHRRCSSSVLLISLIGRVLLDVALLTLLLRIFHALLAMRRLIANRRFVVAGSLRALVLGRNGWNPAHHVLVLLFDEEFMRQTNVPAIATPMPIR